MCICQHYAIHCRIPRYLVVVFASNPHILLYACNATRCKKDLEDDRVRTHVHLTQVFLASTEEFLVTILYKSELKRFSE